MGGEQPGADLPGGGLLDEEHVPATVATLLVAALYLGASCKEPNDAYMRCRAAGARPGDRDGVTYDARACADDARAVLGCARRFFRALGASACAEAWLRMARCVDANNLAHMYCRGEQRALDACMAGLGAAFGGAAGAAPPGPERLWLGTGRDGRGTRAPGTYPEDGAAMYAWHVLRHRRPYPG